MENRELCFNHYEAQCADKIQEPDCLQAGTTQHTMQRTLTSPSAGGGPTGMWAHVPFRVVPDRALQTMDQPPVAYPQAPSLGLA